MTSTATPEATTLRSHRWGRALAAITAIVLAAIAARWLTDPASASLIFGVRLDGPQLAYGRVKGAEDLLIAVMIAAFLVRGGRREVALVLTVGSLLPITDALALPLSGVPAGFQELWIHSAFLLVMATSIALLRRAPTTGKD